MKKLLASLMLIVSSVTGSQTINTLDPSQVYSTANLVNNTTSPSNTTGLWQNVGSWNQGLPCWSPQDAWYYGAYCGPAPYFNNGMFNFSWGVTDVHQYVSIANALPNSGSGVRVNGYNFGFTAKNGNGWDGAGLDTLSAYVTFYGSNGATVRNDSYNLNYRFDWTTFNYSQTFNTPYASSDLSTVRYGFIGGDTSNYWAGPYGPEVYNINFSLKYSVDPCVTNPLYSASCPGFSDALTKLTITATPNTNTSTATTTTPTTTITTTVTDDPINPTVTVTSAPVTQTTTQTSSTTQTTSQQNSGGRVDNSLGLSVVSRNQQREQSIAMQAVQNAITTANGASAMSQQEALSVAAAAVTNSTSSNSFSIGPNNGLGLKLSNSQNSFNSSQINDLSMNNESYVMNYNNMLLDRTNPLNEYANQKPNFSTGPTFSGPTVNRNAETNEAAGGIDLTKMAIAPTGYNDYLNFTMKDASFYTPKEVYKNQKNVDNARVLRQLTNDSRHQELVEQQYRR